MTIRYEKITDYIKVFNIIPENICKDLINSIEMQEWRSHSWYNVVLDEVGSEETKELDVTECTTDNFNILRPFIIESGRLYNSAFAIEKKRLNQLIFEFSIPRFNRYRKDQIMRVHYDHIHSLFDGNKKGIPVLSFIGNLNDNYEGGELVFFDGEYKLNLKAGDICIFPSCFMYPHEVYEVTKGTRYSFVVWAW